MFQHITYVIFFPVHSFPLSSFLSLMFAFLFVLLSNFAFTFYLSLLFLFAVFFVLILLVRFHSLLGSYLMFYLLNIFLFSLVKNTF